MKKLNRMVALALALVLSVVMLPQAVAYGTADFSDVPTTHWAYTNIMEMADTGIIKGVGDGKYAPADTLSVASFLALVGRAMYPADCNEAGTSIWWETYYRTAVAKGVILATEYLGMASDMDRDISRNEMARILIRVDENINGNPAVSGDSSKIADGATIPTEFKNYAAQAYAKGLLTGDENGNFNGSASLSRAEAATVIQRLLGALDAGMPIPTGELTLNHTQVNMSYANSYVRLEATGGTGTLTWTSSDTSVAAVTGAGGVNALGSGTCVITVVDEEGKTATCTINSTFAYTTTPLTGEMVTVTIRGEVSYFDHTHDPATKYPAGIQLTWKTEDGRVLGTAVSFETPLSEYGYTAQGYNYVMVATIDKADLVLDRIKSETQDQYYRMECTYIDENGVRYSNISKITMRGDGFTIYSDNASKTNPYDFTAKFGFTLLHLDSQFLDF